MTWAEIKKAAKDAGINDQDDINEIRCHKELGNKTLLKVHFGQTLVLVENYSQEASNQSSGCTC